MELKDNGILGKVAALALFGIAIVISLLLPSEFAYAADSGQVNPPHAFVGSVTVDGENAPPGTVVEAVINGTVAASTEVGADGKYTLLVQGANPGDTITFTVAGQTVSASGTFEIGRISQMDLNASGAAATTPAPTTAAPAPSDTPIPPTSVPEPPTAIPAPTSPPEPPTSMPTPTDTPVPPTATPVPAQFDSVQSAFRVGPTVRLRPVNDVIDQDTDGLVEILFRNPVLNETVMVVDVTVTIPSGTHIYGEGFATDTAGGAASGSFRTPPGQSRTIYVSIKSEQIGRFTIHFSGAYWPEGNKDLFNPISLTHPFVVNAPSPEPLNPAPTNPDQAPAAANPAAAPASPQEQQGPPGASCSLSPERRGIEGAGDMALLALPLFGLAGLVSWRRNRSRL